VTATSDKIVLSAYANNFNDFWAIKKSDMLNGCQTTTYNYFHDTHPVYRAVVQEGTPVSDAHLVSFHLGSSDALLVTITGTPPSASGTVVTVGSAPNYVGAQSDPAVPGGNLGGGKLLNDVLNAVEEQRSVDNHRVIALASTQPCTSGHGHLCGWLNYIDLNVHNLYGNPPINFFTVIDFSYYGIDATYPAVALDGYGNFYATYSYSSASATPSAAASGFNPAGAALWAPAIIYGNTPNTTACGGGTCNERWGDYNGAARDGSSTGNVWLGSLYQQSSGQSGWGTVVTHATSARVGD
jgi:hypothetical protein